MIDALAERTAYKLKELNPEKTASVEVMKYGIIMSFNGFAVTFISLLIGYIGGKFTETLMTIIFCAIFRFFAGGYHFNSALVCILFSTGLISVLPYIIVTDHWSMILNSISLILVLLFAPSNIENQTRIPSKYFPLLKAISLLLVLINFFPASPILAKVFFTQSLLLVRFKGVFK